MILSKFKGQASYRHGQTMCTTACVCACVAALCNRDTFDQIENIMNVASMLHGRLQARQGHALMSVRDVVECREWQQFTMKIDLDEKSMVSKDFADEREGDEDDDFFIKPRQILERIHKKSAVILTAMDHSTCIFYNENLGGTCYFDPAPATLFSSMDENDILKILNDMSQSVQCDVNFIKISQKRVKT